ncbi:MAG TPA: hypothetical protein DHU63_06145 [Candidatus Marinimicrobia bacterium]|nr:MAG: hypothetical protein AUJ47_11435 [Candidatus Marinimicrobia bacterium CG1_02_48_14]PIZ70249.1 MAG: hypothetical protein COY19_00530 [Candidatus Marinimicrobia bacterium CG_4_10_14_0_2_um_filter_48_9]HCW76104.1 hypothetical protein [Candidatus Neomarinimicrobiota bacterium]
MLRNLLHSYLPYGAVDLLMVVAIITELLNARYDLLWANVPLLVLGLWSFSRKLNRIQVDADR